MRIKKYLSQNRRDFFAIFECEHCGYEFERQGYDDNYFHETVIPKMKCPKCEKTAGNDYQPHATKYPEGMQV